MRRFSLFSFLFVLSGCYNVTVRPAPLRLDIALIDSPSAQPRDIVSGEQDQDLGHFRLLPELDLGLSELVVRVAESTEALRETVPITRLDLFLDSDPLNAVASAFRSEEPVDSGCFCGDFVFDLSAVPLQIPETGLGIFFRGDAAGVSETPGPQDVPPNTKGRIVFVSVELFFVFDDGSATDPVEAELTAAEGPLMTFVLPPAQLEVSLVGNPVNQVVTNPDGLTSLTAETFRLEAIGAGAIPVTGITVKCEDISVAAAPFPNTICKSITLVDDASDTVLAGPLFPVISSDGAGGESGLQRFSGAFGFSLPAGFAVTVGAPRLVRVEIVVAPLGDPDNIDAGHFVAAGFQGSIQIPGGGISSGQAALPTQDVTGGVFTVQ